MRTASAILNSQGPPAHPRGLPQARNYTSQDAQGLRLRIYVRLVSCFWQPIFESTEHSHLPKIPPTIFSPSLGHLRRIAYITSSKRTSLVPPKKRSLSRSFKASPSQRLTRYLLQKAASTNGLPWPKQAQGGRHFFGLVRRHPVIRSLRRITSMQAAGSTPKIPQRLRRARESTF